VTTSDSRSAAADSAAAVRRPPPARPTLLERKVLDEEMAASRRDDPQPWGVRTWLGPLVALVAILVAGRLFADAVAPHRKSGMSALGIALTAAVEALVLVVLLVIGRPIARRGGGWRATFGLDIIRSRDWVPWAFGLLVVFAGRMAVGILAAALTRGQGLVDAQNLRVAEPTVGSVVALGLVAVVLAPISEELMFRGLLLRSFMRRTSFWPAALLSTALFGLLHTYEAGSVAGAITLACSVGVVGLGNCYLVRITGRLAPAMMLHASFNALALIAAVLLARH
jgi:membrane protease YdiL (CAAX protease family)